MPKRTGKAQGDGLWKDPRSRYWQIDKEFAGHRLRRSARTSSYDEAKAQVDAWISEIRKRLVLESLGEKPKADAAPELTLNEAVTRYFEELGRRAKSEDQLDENLAWICAHFNPNGDGASTKLSAITENMLLELAAIRRGQGQRGGKKTWRPLSEYTINRAVFDVLRPVLNRAARTWKAHVAAIDWAQLYTPRARQGLMHRELPIAEQPAFMAALRADLREGAEFLLIHGVRAGLGLAQMEWPHVDFDAGVFRIRKKTRLPGEHWQEVPMTARSRQILLAQRGRHPKFVFTYVVHRAHQVGPRAIAKGARRPLTKTVLRQLKRAAKAIGRPELRPHDLRHTMAKRTLRAAKDIRLVQKALAHADIATTAIYADVLVEDVRAGLEAAQAAAEPHHAPAPDEAAETKKRA